VIVEAGKGPFKKAAIVPSTSKMPTNSTRIGTMDLKIAAIALVNE
jgi:hypothetical protein